ncbi:ABC transporter ATP-binding protein [Celeribacter sp.]|uniref:ABC transporter ATP-binding protein n=1 Tax=Celeribacter sp. TaxID=1890673 RepID=UPI003A907027
MTQSMTTEGAQSAPPILSVSGLGKSFGAVHALSEVSFDLRAGEAVGIVGPNGAGKSTFLAALTGAFAPSTGTILLDGADVTGTPAEIMCRRGVVRTHQIPRPFGGLTVFENARLAASFGGPENGDADALAYDALKLCRMLPLANTQADRLGLLDRKRLEMARALATSPRVILLDEVGGGLTDAEAEVLVEIIREIRASGCAIVWIEHIVHVLLQVSERLICMDMGRIIADGEPQAVMRDPAVMEAYLGQGVT